MECSVHVFSFSTQTCCSNQHCYCRKLIEFKSGLEFICQQYNNGCYSNAGFVEKLKTEPLIMLLGVEQETRVDTQEKNTEKCPKMTVTGALTKILTVHIWVA